MLAVYVGFFVISHAAAWYCVPIQSKEIKNSGVIWRTQNCSKDSDTLNPLVVNSIHVDLKSSNVRVAAAIANPVQQVQNLPDMGAENDKFIAGINGGYFWRVDIDGFWRDNVCRGKVRKEAEQDASRLHPNFGIGDGVIKIDGETYASNCNCSGNSRPAVLELDGTKSDIKVLYRGEQPDANVRNALGAGPNLVSYNATSGTSYVDIPADDDNINRFVYEATTAVGLVGKDTSSGEEDEEMQELVMVTTDGSDSCLPNESFCGLFSPDLASLMKEIFACRQAMSMDQGGSTTMWIKDENPDRNGVVSRSDNKEPVENEGARNIANGLFVELL